MANLNETDWVKRLGVTYGLVAEKGKWLTDAKTYFSYSEGVRPNNNIFDKDGNPLTAPQIMKSYELGLKTQWLGGNVDASAALYTASVSNVPNTVFVNIVNSGGTFASVLGGAHLYRGLELELLGEILPGWNVAASYTHTKNSVQSLLFPQRLEIADVPRNQTSLFTSYEFLTGPLKGVLVGAGVVRKVDMPLVDSVQTIYSSKYDPNNQVLWSVTRIDLRASYKGFGGSLKGLNIYGNVYNVTNSRSFLSTDVQGQPGWGNTVGNPRTVTVGVRYGF